MEEKDEKITEETMKTDKETDTTLNFNTESDSPVTDEPANSVAGPSETEKLQQELTELKDKFIRQAAEFDNFRKRTARERLELIQTAGKDIITSLLDVLDDSERAKKQLETTDDINSQKEGVLLVFNKLKTNLLSKGLKVMETTHQDFNPDLHEAITEIPAPSEDLKGKVLDEVQKGYYLHDKIIRFAKVVVGA
jgi:molecular chaperone GrpE